MFKLIYKSLNDYKELNKSKFDKLKKSRNIFLFPGLFGVLGLTIIILFFGSNPVGFMRPIALYGTQATALLLIIHFVKTLMFYFSWCYSVLKKLIKP
tara:strand:- start:1728 stop:2018 length:291 start_codon:yes stop_codon:yes gene_type:complete